ncbi:MAG: TonB-dependent receptor plug domain-containing protein [Bacteroidia bacterium]|nr:TonB-dependent receptor plug domain-containing protein [Bacteroidia bacterium]
MKKQLLLATAVCVLHSLGIAQVAPPQDSLSHQGKVFELGEIRISAPRWLDSAQAIGQATLEAFNRPELGRALNLLSGVNLAGVGPRNESVVYIRGFDLRQVPVFMDGIPVYVPYDGYVDLARFTTFDLAEIRVEKGLSSVLYGPNTMGGAINLVTLRPREKLELNGKLGLLSGAGYRANLNLGSRLGKFYLQGSVSQLERDYFLLSENFQPGHRRMAGDAKTHSARILSTVLRSALPLMSTMSMPLAT